MLPSVATIKIRITFTVLVAAIEPPTIKTKSLGEGGKIFSTKANKKSVT